VEQGEIPTFRGHLLSDEDQRVREQILQFMTRFEVTLQPDQLDDAKSFLASLLGDGLVKFQNNTLALTERGKPFLRNACMFFDYRLRRRQPEARIFSQSL
jgi:oxygen-independent coproporphyrinogen-3 oxidase